MPPPEASAPAAAPGRLLAAFAGAVRISAAGAAVNCRLAGHEQRTGLPLEVHFSGATPVPPAAMLQDAQVYEVSAAGAGPGRHWLIHAGVARHALQARAAQVHRMPDAAFAAAVPPSPLSLATRLGWFVLLLVLRIPGAAQLLSKLRRGRR